MNAIVRIILNDIVCRALIKFDIKYSRVQMGQIVMPCKPYTCMETAHLT